MRHKHVVRIVLCLLLALLLASVYGVAWQRSRQQRLSRALYHAVEQANSARVRNLLSEGADPNVREHPVSPPRGLGQWIKVLLHRKPSAETGDSALMTAAYQGEVQIVGLLIKAGANLNAVNHEDDGNSNTPLLCALYSDQSGNYPDTARKSAIVEMLLNGGANPNQEPGHSYLSPLEQAVDHGSAAIVAMLLAHGARFDPHSEYGRDVCRFAASNPDPGVLTCLLNRGVDPNMQDVNGESLLTQAASNLPVVKLLLSVGVNVNSKDDNGRGSTALEWAETKRYRERFSSGDRKAWDAVIALLKAHGGKR